MTVVADWAPRYMNRDFCYADEPSRPADGVPDEPGAGEAYVRVEARQ